MIPKNSVWNNSNKKSYSWARTGPGLSAEQLQYLKLGSRLPLSGGGEGCPAHGRMFRKDTEVLSHGGSTRALLCSAPQAHPILCDPNDCTTPGSPVLRYFMELAQTHVHRVGDAIQPSHPLSSPSPPAPNPSQHQGLFQ